MILRNFPSADLLAEDSIFSLVCCFSECFGFSSNLITNAAVILPGNGRKSVNYPLVCVSFSSVKSRQIFIKSINEFILSKPSSLEPVYAKVRTNLDLTYAQRKANHNLIEEANRRKSNGEANIKIDWKNKKIMPL